MMESKRDSKTKSEKAVLRCGFPMERNHVVEEGRIYGIYPMAHCDTNCPYAEGTCVDLCLSLPITLRPCMKEDYGKE